MELSRLGAKDPSKWRHLPGWVGGEEIKESGLEGDTGVVGEELPVGVAGLLRNTDVGSGLVPEGLVVWLVSGKLEETVIPMVEDSIPDVEAWVVREVKWEVVDFEEDEEKMGT